MDTKEFSIDDWEKFKKENKMPQVRIATSTDDTKPVKAAVKAAPDNSRMRSLMGLLLPLTEEYSPKEILAALADLSYEKGQAATSEAIGKEYKNQTLRYRLASIVSNSRK